MAVLTPNDSVYSSCIYAIALLKILFNEKSNGYSTGVQPPGIITETIFNASSCSLMDAFL